ALLEPETAVGTPCERGPGDQQRVSGAERARHVRLGHATIAAAIGNGVPLKHDDRGIGRRRRPAGDRPGGPERRADRRSGGGYEIPAAELVRHWLLSPCSQNAPQSWFPGRWKLGQMNLKVFAMCLSV